MNCGMSGSRGRLEMTWKILSRKHVEAKVKMSIEKGGIFEAEDLLGVRNM